LVPIINEELLARSNAFKVRGVTFSKGVKGMFERLRLYMLHIFAQSIRRAQRLAIAMEAKRFQIGSDRTYYYPTSYQPIDGVFALLLISLSFGAYFLS